MTNCSLQEMGQRIYFVRGYQVMLDIDLAELYESETRILNQVVRRNHFKFPYDFMFQLTSEESDHITNTKKIEDNSLRSQIVILNFVYLKFHPYEISDQTHRT